MLEDKPTAAALLGVDVSTVYDWLAGKDPRNVDLVRLGIAAALRPEIRATLDADHAGAELASHVGHRPHSDHPDGDVMADPEGRDAFSRLSLLFKNKGKDRKAWEVAVEMLKRLTPPRAARTARDAKKARRTGAQ